MLNAIEDNDALPNWLRNGGVETLQSYGWTGNQSGSLGAGSQRSHRVSPNLCTLPRNGDHIMTHAGYVADMAMEDQPALALRWRTVEANANEPHVSGKTVIVGHSAQRSGQVLDYGHVKCIDTNCVPRWLANWNGCLGRGNLAVQPTGADEKRVESKSASRK